MPCVVFLNHFCHADSSMSKDNQMCFSWPDSQEDDSALRHMEILSYIKVTVMFSEEVVSWHQVQYNLMLS
jgi:hypothetical protein